MSPMTTMPFGKHRGVPLSELPGGYVEWLGDKLEEWREPFRSAIAAELDRRKGSTLPGSLSESTPGPSRRGSVRRQASELPAPTVCDVCGLGPTDQRPLVHASCVDSEVPF